MQGTKNRHEMRIMDPTEGDTRHTWDPEDEDEVALMRDIFKKQTKKGMTAFRTKGKGKKGEFMKEFDPDAEAVIFAPQLQGG